MADFGVRTDFGMRSGTYRVVQHTVFEQDGTTPFDLTGVGSVKFTVSNLDSTGTVLQPKGTTAKIGPITATITDAPNGVTESELVAAATATLKNGQYYWEIEVIDGTGRPFTSGFGILTIARDLNTPIT